MLAPIQNKVNGKPAFKNRNALGGALFTGRPLGGAISGTCRDKIYELDLRLSGCNKNLA